jgi:hypothetical protein
MLDPRLLFPVLAAVFALLALQAGLRRGRWRGAPLTWAWIALVFGAVSAWLHFGA